MCASIETERTRREATGRGPDFFIIGQPKTGTTALYEMLRAHPEVFMPDLKEPLFYAADLRPLRQAGESRAGFPASRDEYLSLFAPAGRDQVAGEASTSYLRSTVAAAAIAQAHPEARLIAVLRDPATLVRSLHLQRLQEGFEIEPDLERALALEEDRRRGVNVPAHLEQPQMLFYLDFTKYVEQLRRFASVFPQQQLLVIIYDDFRADNAQTVRSALHFLGVDDSVPIGRVDANPTVGARRSGRAQSLARSVQAGRGPLTRPLKRVTRLLTTPGFRARVIYPLHRRISYRQPPDVDARVMTDLRRRLLGEVVALSEYLDRDLVGLWGYDSLD